MDNTLEKIYKSGLKLLVPLTSEEVYKTIVEEAIRLVDADYGSILLAKKGELKRVYASSEVAFQTKIRKRANTYKAFTTHQPVISHISETGKAHPEMEEVGVKWTIFIPLSYRGRAIGVLNINSKKNQKFSKKELNILKLFGSMASLAIRKTQLYDETRQALEGRDKFISLATHELRTPLTSLLGYGQLLYSKSGNKNGPEVSWTREIITQGMRLSHLIKELVEVHRINTQTDQYTWSTCNLIQLVKSNIEKINFSNPNRVIKLNSQLNDSDATVVADTERLADVIGNFLENAVKFSKEDSKVEVLIKLDKQLVVLEIKDSGEGMEKEELNRLFEGYYKSKENYRQGMGLGFYLAKNILTKHKGVLVVRSKKNYGTTIQIKLPQAKI